MEQTLADLRALQAASRIRSRAIAARLGMVRGTLSRYLSGDRTPPADFEPRFRAAVAELAAEMAQAERDAGESRAQAILQAAGVIEEVAA